MRNLRLIGIGLVCSWLGCGSESSNPFGSTSNSSGPVLTGAGGGAGEGGSGATGGMGGMGGMGNGGAGSGGGSGGQAGNGSGGAAGFVDLDLDGLDDVWETQVAEDYLPFLSLDPGDKCPRGGIVVRVRPHPDKAGLIHIVYDHLYERDCGLTSHVGDNEAFGATIDPNIPPPAGLLTLVAIGHQSTICEKKTTCGSCGGLDACATAMKNGAAYPVVFSSKDKHAGYVQKDKCNPILSCFDSCSLAPTSKDVPIVNVGEPEAPLVTDLTDQAFINEANGWTEQELFHLNPWDTAKDFGGAGNVAGDLVDSAFVPPVCP
jgi:hypothetical protein